MSFSQPFSEAKSILSSIEVQRGDAGSPVLHGQDNPAPHHPHPEMLPVRTKIVSKVKGLRRKLGSSE